MPISGIVPLTVQFTDTTSGHVTAWLWQFGDGGTSALQHPQHTYTSAGTYYVTLYATTADGVVQQSDYVIAGLVSVPYTGPAMDNAGLPGDDPQVMLRISNDGGKTWITEQWRSAGKVGEWSQRVRWNRLGSARRRVLEVSVTDPAPWKITGAYLELGPGSNGASSGR